MKHIAVYSLLLAMIMLAGCPCMTEVPMDNGSYEVPSWLPGKWLEISKEGKTKPGYYLMKLSQKGNLKSFEIDTNGKVTNNSGKNVILSSVAGKIFLSSYAPADEGTEAGYYIFEFRKVSDKEFTITGLKEHEIAYDATPAQIISFLERNKDNSSIFDPDEKYTYRKL